MSPAEEKALEAAAVAAELAGEVVARARGEALPADLAALFAEVAAEMSTAPVSLDGTMGTIVECVEEIDDGDGDVRELLLAIAASALSTILTLDAEARR